MKNLKPILVALIIFWSLVSIAVAQTDRTDLIKYNDIKWKFSTNGAIHGSPVKSDNALLFGSSDQHIYSVNKNTGDLIWKYKTEGAVYSTPLISQNTVFCTSMDGNLYAIDKESGTLNWKFKSAIDHQEDIWDYHGCSPSINDDLIYYGNGEGEFFAINKNNGVEEWSYQTEGAIHSTPIVNENKVFFGNFNGFFYALDSKTGNKLWKFNTIGQRWFPRGAIQQGASSHKNMLYFGSRDFNIYALNTETGKGMWNMYEQGSWVIATPVVADSLLLFGTSDTHRFYALDNRNGKIIWKTALSLNVFGQCEVGTRLIYVGALDGKVYALRKKDGKIMWEFQTEESKEGWDDVFNEHDRISKRFIENHKNDMKGFYEKIHSMGSIVSKPLLDNGVLFVTSMNGKIYALE